MTISVSVERNGKILIPVNIRRILEIREGESDLLLNVDEANKSITLETRDQALARTRARLAKHIPGGHNALRGVAGGPPGRGFA